MTRCATDEAERREFLDAFRASGVTGIFQNAGEEGNDPLRLLKRLARFTYTTDLLRDRARQGGPPRRRGRREEGGHALPGLHHQRGAADPALGERCATSCG